MAELPHLDRIIDLLRATSTRNEVNALVFTWGPAAGAGQEANSQRYASKEDIKDGEKFRAGEVANVATTRWQVLWDPLTETLDVKDRLAHEGEVHEIVGIKEIGHRLRRELTTVNRTENA